MTLRLDERNRPEADVLVTSAGYDPDRTWYAPADVVLAAEAVSPESAHRDRTVKLRKYRRTLQVSTPFAIDLDLDGLVPRRTT